MGAPALALALALAAAGPDTRTQLPPAPRALFRVAWQRPFVGLRPLEWKPQERGGVAVDRSTGVAVAGTRDGWLHALRPDGTIAWEAKGDGSGFGPPAIDGDTVYVGSADGRLYAVAIATGKERWHYQSEEDLSTRPAVSGGVVLVAGLRDTLYAIDARTGAWKWHHRREQKTSKLTIFGAADARAGGGSAYAAYSDGTVAALDVATGQARWERQVSPAGDQLDVDSIQLDGERLYAAAYAGAVLAVDARTGRALWTAQVPAASRLGLASGLLVTVTPTSVIGLSPADGSTVWTSPLDGAPAGEPAVAGRWLLVPAGSGGLRWIEAASGRTLRVFDGGTGVCGAPAVRGGRVYVLSNGGDLFALDLE